MPITLRRGYIYGAIKGHRDAMFTEAVQSIDRGKPNTNPNTNLTVILIQTLTLTLFDNPNRKIITLLIELEFQTPTRRRQILNK